MTMTGRALKAPSKYCLCGCGGMKAYHTSISSAKAETIKKTALQKSAKNSQKPHKDPNASQWYSKFYRPKSRQTVASDSLEIIRAEFDTWKDMKLAAECLLMLKSSQNWEQVPAMTQSMSVQDTVEYEMEAAAKGLLLLKSASQMQKVHQSSALPASFGLTSSPEAGPEQSEDLDLKEAADGLTMLHVSGINKTHTRNRCKKPQALENPRLPQSGRHFCQPIVSSIVTPAYAQFKHEYDVENALEGLLMLTGVSAYSHIAECKVYLGSEVPEHPMVPQDLAKAKHKTEAENVVEALLMLAGGVAVDKEIAETENMIMVQNTKQPTIVPSCNDLSDGPYSSKSNPDSLISTSDAVLNAGKTFRLVTLNRDCDLPASVVLTRQHVVSGETLMIGAEVEVPAPASMETQGEPSCSGVSSAWKIPGVSQPITTPHTKPQLSEIEYTVIPSCDHSYCIQESKGKANCKQATAIGKKFNKSQGIKRKAENLEQKTELKTAKGESVCISGLQHIVGSNSDWYCVTQRTN